MEEILARLRRELNRTARGYLLCAGGLAIVFATAWIGGTFAEYAHLGLIVSGYGVGVLHYQRRLRRIVDPR